MRVLVLTPEFVPVYGGVGNYVVQIAKNMPPDVELHIVSPRHVLGDRQETKEASEESESLPENIRVTHLGKAEDTFFHNFAFQLNCSQFVPEVVRKERIDLVHSQSAMPDYFVSPKRLGVPMVTTMHTTVEGHYQALRGSGHESLSASERFVLMFGPTLGLMERRYYTNRRHYITVSDWAKKAMTTSQGIDAERIRVIRIGVDPLVFSPSKAREAATIFPKLAGLQVPKVLYLSRLAARKGIHTFLKAASIALGKVDAHFVIAGAGGRPDISLPDRSYTFLGYVPRHMPPYLYALSDIFTLPSSYENFPACILEAMASGSAVISTPVGGIPEMIQDGVNGLLVQPNDVGALAGAIVRLIEDDASRRAMSSKGMKYAVGSYSWRDAALKTRDYYEDIA